MVADEILVGLVTSLIYDIAKHIVGIGKDKLNREDVSDFVAGNLSAEYGRLAESGILQKFLESPIFLDTIDNYMTCMFSGRYIAKVSHEMEDTVEIFRSEMPDENKIIEFLTQNLMKKYRNSGVLWQPDQHLLDSFFRALFRLGTEFMLSCMDKKELRQVFLINYKMNRMGLRIFDQIEELRKVLERSMLVQNIDTTEEYTDIRESYMRLLRENHRESHVYLLDKIDMEKFYVPPILNQAIETEEDGNFNEGAIKGRNIHVRRLSGNSDSWKYIFDRSNIVYITGGAGYGKTLFMKNMLMKYEKLNILHPQEYLVIYGELKYFFQNDLSTPVPVLDYLQYCMKRETLMDEQDISKEMINYYLRRGRCLILLDALDEVDRSVRGMLHSRVVKFFQSQNPNNKVCITSRARGFLPENRIEVFEIKPLTSSQIRKYVDNIINMGKFAEEDRDDFLIQAQELVNRGFLSSFLVLSLLMNIYKAERELPENKLELYRKCFDYISNRRERDKLSKKYDWQRISTLMKQNTFMELANLCIPNNKEVSREKIIEVLTRIYSRKYHSEAETEQALEEFLDFCGERTELFVLASGEEHYKFFHRSFFEYFYALYINTRMTEPAEIYEAWKQFDIDSEIFELTLAMFKEQNETKYQRMVDFLFERIQEKTGQKQDKLYAVNVMILCLRVIDDQTYQDKCVDFLVNEAEFCKENIRDLHNQQYITEMLETNDTYIEKIYDVYRENAAYEVLVNFMRHIWTLADVFSDEVVKKWKDEETEEFKDELNLSVYDDIFYEQVFAKKQNFRELMKMLNTENISELGEKLGIDKSNIDAIIQKYTNYLSMEVKRRTLLESLIKTY